MPAIASNRLERLLLLLMLALAGCAGQLFAASCDQPPASFQAGQLTISSEGCSLQEVLTAVGRKTGIETKLPASTSTVPVFANLGPGNPRQVVSALLDGVPFNWSLAIAEGGSPRLLGVVLTEQVRPPQATTSLAQGALTGAVSTESGKQLAGGALSGTKAKTINKDGMGRDVTTEASLAEQPEGQRKERAEIDDATLSKLPPLPAGVPTAMWQLYPDLVANIVANGGANQGGSAIFPNRQLPSAASSLTPNGSGEVSVAKGCQACPVPPGVDPAIRNLYPANLMQLLGGPVKQPNTPVYPMAPPITAPH